MIAHIAFYSSIALSAMRVRLRRTLSKNNGGSFIYFPFGGRKILSDLLPQLQVLE